jgi:hypothetical protein
MSLKSWFGAAGRAARDDRRKCSRFALKSAVEASWNDRDMGPCVISGRGLDISDAGVGLVCSEPIPVGAAVYMDLPEVGLAGSGRVRHSDRKLLNYRIGVELFGSLGPRL